MLKLPKNILSHPRVDALEKFFSASEIAMREGTAVRVSKWPLDAALRAGLHAAFGTGHLMQGLELIAQTLDREAKGLKAVQEKTGQAPAHRLSRLILLANDGTDRFYRDAEAVLHRHAERTWGAVVAATSSDLGKQFTAKGGPAKALMIDDKDALGLFLTAIAGALA